MLELNDYTQVFQQTERIEGTFICTACHFKHDLWRPTCLKCGGTILPIPQVPTEFRVELDADQAKQLIESRGEIQPIALASLGIVAVVQLAGDNQCWLRLETASRNSGCQLSHALLVTPGKLPKTWPVEEQAGTPAAKIDLSTFMTLLTSRSRLGLQFSMNLQPIRFGH